MSLKRSDLIKAVGHLEKGDWQAAHVIVQEDEQAPLSCWAHGIVHMMEGDIPNARYWYKLAKKPFPASPSIAEEIANLKAALLA